MTGHGAAAGTLGRIVRHEARAMRSLALWAARRTHGVGADGQAFGYARGQAAMVYGIAFACLVETVGISCLLRDLPVAHAVMLVLDVYTLLTILALQSAAVTHPHVLTGRSLRIRRGVTVDLLVPLADLTAVRRELRTSPDHAAGRTDPGHRGAHQRHRGTRRPNHPDHPPRPDGTDHHHPAVRGGPRRPGPRTPLTAGGRAKGR